MFSSDKICPNYFLYLYLLLSRSGNSIPIVLQKKKRNNTLLRENIIIFLSLVVPIRLIKILLLYVEFPIIKNVKLDFHYQRIEFQNNFGGTSTECVHTIFTHRFCCDLEENRLVFFFLSLTLFHVLCFFLLFIYLLSDDDDTR